MTTRNKTKGGKKEIKRKVDITQRLTNGYIKNNRFRKK